jgi:hypothetical protein
MQRNEQDMEHWRQIAREYIGLHTEFEGAKVNRYAEELAMVLYDHAEQFVESDIPQMEEERLEAARDAWIDAQLDEARGK